MAPPAWSTGLPTEPGIYVGFSQLRAEMGNVGEPEMPSVYAFDGKAFQSWIGWYDNAIDHWMKTDLPLADPLSVSDRHGTPSPNSGLTQEITPSPTGTSGT